MHDDSDPTERVALSIDTTDNDTHSADVPSTSKRMRSYESVVHSHSFIRVLSKKSKKMNKNNEGSLVTNEPISHSQPTNRIKL